MATTYHVKLPAGKVLTLDIEYKGHKEQALLVEVADEVQDYIRNNVEATPVNGEYGHYTVSRTYGPWNVDKDVYLEGESKDCYVGDNCGGQPWWPAIRRVENETATTFNVWWDEGSNPPVNKHINVTGTIK